MKKQANKSEKKEVVNVDDLPSMVNVSFLTDVKTHKKGDTAIVGKYVAKNLIERGLVEIL